MSVDYNFSQELNSIDYDQLIGAPLNAAVDAHNRAAMKVAEFIQEVGFESQGPLSGDTVRMVEFSYTRDVTDSTGSTSSQQFTFRVPFILLLNLPYMEVATVDVDFNVQLQSLETASTDTAFGITGEVSGKHSWLVGGVKFKVKSQYQRKTHRGTEVQRKYNQSVKVHAESVEAPDGVNTLLDTLSTLATEQEASGGGGGGGSP